MHPDLNKPQTGPYGPPPPAGPPEPPLILWMKAHKAVTAVCGGALAIVVLGAIASAGRTVPVAAPVPLSSAPFSPTPVVGVPGNVPDLIGKGLPSAETLLRTAGFFSVTAHDSSNGGRMQFNDPNWKVCFQDPKPGRYPANTPIDLGVVKRAEACPAVDGTAVTAVPTG